MTQTYRSDDDPWFNDCPVCRAEPKRSCRYVEGAEHNGWYHVARYKEDGK
jgi:hypothetical protein